MNALDKIAELEAENARLRASVINQAGDNLCWLKDEDLGKALPLPEFLESCQRYHAQISENGVTARGKTIAQLEAEVERLRTALREINGSERDPDEYYINLASRIKQIAAAALAGSPEE